MAIGWVFSSLPVGSSNDVLYPRCYMLSVARFRHHPPELPWSSGAKAPGLAVHLPMVSLYAGDTSVIVSSDAAIRAVFSAYSRFKNRTGSKSNLGKCCSVWLGTWRGQRQSPVAIQWSSDKIKILGVFVGHSDLAMANWLHCLETVKKCLASWKGQALSFSGKAVVLNAQALSRI